MASPYDCANLGTVKAFIAPQLLGSTASDWMLSRMITAVSQGFDHHLSRRLMAQNYTEMRNGNQRDMLRTKNYPIISVSSLSISGQPVAQAQDTVSAGFVNDDKYIYIRDMASFSPNARYWQSIFYPGFQNVAIQYSAGYLMPGQIELADLPPWTAAQHYLAATAVNPGNGWYYSVVRPGISGATSPVWPVVLGAQVADGNILWQNEGQFFAPPAGATALPEHVTMACCTQVSYLFAMRSRIGDVSTGEGSQRVTYMTKDIHPVAAAWIAPMRNVVPIVD